MERTEAGLEQNKISLPFSFFAGPAAWAVQLLAGYGLSAQACLAGTKLWIYLISALAAIVVLVSAVLAFRAWRGYARAGVSSDRAGSASDWTPASGGMLMETEGRVSRQEFVAISGALLSSVFLLVILMTGGAMIFMNPCPIITMPLP